MAGLMYEVPTQPLRHVLFLVAARHTFCQSQTISEHSPISPSAETLSEVCEQRDANTRT